MLKRILSVIMALCLLTSVFASCKKSPDPANSSSDSNSSLAENIDSEKENTLESSNTSVSQEVSSETLAVDKIENGYLRLAKGRKLSFSVVRPEDGTIEEIQACADFVSELSKYYDNVEFYNDTKEAATGVNEIMLGKTSRKQSQNFNEKLKDGNDYSVGVVDNQIVIAATGATGLKLACKYFIENFVAAKKDKIKLDYFYAFSKNVTELKINGVDISKYKIIHPRAASYIYTSEITDLTKTILQVTGNTVKVLDEREKESDYEILIGPTTRSASKTLVEKDSYSITVSGKKLIINAGSENALSSAVYRLNSYILENKDKNINLKSDFSLTGTYSYLKGKYKLVWNDEFDGNKLDTKKWSYKTGWDGEFVEYTNKEENTNVSNGTMKQTCLKNVGENKTTYTVSHINTAQSMSFIYGYCEIRVKLPTGMGIWPAFWGNYSEGNLGGFQEIDIFELFARNDRRIAFNLHKWWYDVDPFSGAEIQRNQNLDGAGLKKDVEFESERMGDAWHTIGIVWTDKSVIALFDGYPYFEQSITGESDDIFHTPIYLIVNHIIVPNAVGTDADTPFPNTMETDYIRLYQLPETDKLYLK